MKKYQRYFVCATDIIVQLLTISSSSNKQLVCDPTVANIFKETTANQAVDRVADSLKQSV